MTIRRKWIWIAAPVTALLLLLGAEAGYVTCQRLEPPGTLQLGGVIMAAQAKKLDLSNCLLAGQPTGWTGYRGYVGFVQGDEQKLDAVSQAEGLVIGGDVLRNCESIDMSFSAAEPYTSGDLKILNRFNQIWFKIERY